MFDDFFRIFKAFEAAGLAEPLLETLKFLDILSNGAVRGMDGNFPYLKEFELDLDALISSRREDIPLEYILGQTTFMGMKFKCTPATLIPRQETELLCRTALTLIRQWDDKPLIVIDMGTGCGNLAVSIATYAENTHILASDVSPEAIEIAKEHVNHYKLDSRISLFCGDMFEPIAAANYADNVDMVVCNPPYIPTSSLSKMAPEVVEHEPVLAFDAGAFGIDIFRRLIVESDDFLKATGVLLFEIGEGQEKFVTRMLERSSKYVDIRYYKDSLGKTRVVSAVKKSF